MRRGRLRSVRFVTALAALALVATLGGYTHPPAVAADTSPFTDIVGTTFEADIDWLYAEGITVGCTPALYCPERTVTRGEMASFLVRMFGLTEGGDIDAFPDDDGTTHEADINRLAASGITKGCSDGSFFCPYEPVRRDEMATFLVRAIPLIEGAGRNYFRDDDGTTHEANIDRAAAAGIASGCGTWRFCPYSPLTRGQMAGLLHRVDKPVGPPAYPAPDIQERFVTIGGTDTDNDCVRSSNPCRSIERAVNQSFDGDVVNIGPGTFRAEVFLSVGITLRGAGVGSTILDGNDTTRVLTTYTGPPPNNGHVYIEGVTITGGRTAGDGGAIANYTNLQISDAEISDSTAGAGGGAIFNANGSNLTIIASTFSGNEAGGRGGAILNVGYMTIHASTFDSNSARHGGAIYHWAYPAIISSSTIVANSANDQGGGLVVDDELLLINATVSQNVADEGGGIWVNPAAEFSELDARNAIVAGNVAPSDPNLHGPATKLNSIVGIPAGLTLADILDPAGLADNGGPTRTIALTDSPTNPAIDTGHAATCAAAPISGLDQRGLPRMPPCDIGAYELQP